MESRHKQATIVWRLLFREPAGITAQTL